MDRERYGDTVYPWGRDTVFTMNQKSFEVLSDCARFYNLD
jgi:hypothetical protein